jgi:hypothetical protein
MNFFNSPLATKTHKTKDNFTKLIELLARGVFTKEKTIISKDFSWKVWKYLILLGAVETDGLYPG